jgi:hypothetical protein
MIGERTFDRESLVPEWIRLDGQDQGVVKASLQGV